MIETIQQLESDLASRRPTAYCRLVETRGSTPQKAGALMLVYENGEQAGTLGGGCVEAEVKRHAIRVISNGKAELATFSLDHDYGWDDGLICGGRMTIWIAPTHASSAATSYFRNLVELAKSTLGFTEAVAFDAEKSGISAPGSFLLDSNDRLVGSLGTSLDSGQMLLPHIRPIVTRPRAYAEMGVAFLPLAKRCRLVIVGGGHIGQAVAALATDLDFEVWVTDDRESYVSEERFPSVTQRIAGPCKEVLPSIEITPDTYCLVVTRGHNHDQEALYHLVDRGARYVGMIGSKRKIRLIFEDLAAEGISADLLASVFAPVGIDIGSQTVPEIAVSIAAELIAHRNCAGQVPGRPESAFAG